MSLKDRIEHTTKLLRNERIENGLTIFECELIRNELAIMEALQRNNELHEESINLLRIDLQSRGIIE